MGHHSSPLEAPTKKETERKKSGKRIVKLKKRKKKGKNSLSKSRDALHNFEGSLTKLKKSVFLSA